MTREVRVMRLRFEVAVAATIAGALLPVRPAWSAPVSASRSETPAWHMRRGTWHETIVASREALAVWEQSQPASPQPEPFASEIIRGGQAARPVRVRVSGARELFLLVAGAPDAPCGAATWADARLVAADGSETRLDGRNVRVLQGQSEFDRTLESGVSGPLRIAGRQFSHGIHVYANSTVVVPLNGRYEWFEATIGIDDWVKARGAVRMYAGGAGAKARVHLWEWLATEFSEGQPRREMRWAREDDVLAEDWRPGDCRSLARRYAAASFRVKALAESAARAAESVSDAAGLESVRQVYLESRSLDEARARSASLGLEALHLAVQDLVATFGDRYPQGPAWLSRTADLGRAVAAARTGAEAGDPAALRRLAGLVGEFDALQRDALLANPLLSFDKLLLIRRTPRGDPRGSTWADRGLGEYVGMPRQSSWTIATMDPEADWDNEIAVLSPVRPDGRLATLYRPAAPRLVTDIDLHFDAGEMLFTMPGTQDRWQVFELTTDAAGQVVGPPRQVTRGKDPDVDNYDACYLPDGRILFISTAGFQGVPCNAGVIVGMLYRMDADGGNVRQLCFEQDHDYCPSLLNDGRVLYLRWEYTDTPHVWNRVLFSMNPDGTEQREYYGANSYWPNAVFFARAIPEHPTQVAGVVTGHHQGRVGDLVIFDPARGQREADGVVQRIPGRGRKVEPVIEDKLTEHNWPKFLHPFPLSDKYFLVSCKPAPESLWGIYLVDVFDNMVLVKELEQSALLEPIPFRPRATPPVIADRVIPGRRDAVVNLTDVYSGPAMNGVPRGSVRRLRVFTYHFGYRAVAGIDDRVGTDGPWEIKRVLGTVPVEEDGSAMFRVPANTPISVQPLDGEGKALQLMRSWTTGMPGEVVSCVGCHETRTTAPPNRRTMASRRPPVDLAPDREPERGFSFRREIQPVLDRYCVGCHDGRSREGVTPVDLRADQGAYAVYELGKPELTLVRNVPREQLIRKSGGVFEPSYLALRRFVRVGGLESDLHLLYPMEFHADTCELVQMLSKGHHNVRLDAEAWDRLVTWIDLNAPCHGTWNEMTVIKGNQPERRRELRRAYAGVDEDCEAVPDAPSEPVAPVLPEPLPPRPRPALACEGWPFGPEAARSRQTADGPAERTIDLGDGIRLDLVRIPAGSFVMGSADGDADEYPPTVVRVSRPFWMGRCEVTNEQYAQFDAAHDSRFEDRTSWIFSEPYLGWKVSNPAQPVVRVSWNQAVAFCRWLSSRLGEEVSLPTEAEWEYACRAGTVSPLSYGGLDTDFAPFANEADATIRELAYGGWRPLSPDIVPREARCNDGALVTASVGSYRPNAWGLFDMHGNAAEWTRSAAQPYPYREDDGRNAISPAGKRIVRGGSWYDRPYRCRSSYRLAYREYQPVFNVGFRIVCRPRGES
jgi:formylglycine-generating enzyme required for sulfatase activity